MIGDRQLARLVKFFTDAPSSKYTPEDISITFGEARINYNTKAEDYDATGFVDRSVYGKLMLDAATLAAGSLIEDRFVVNDNFNTYAMKPLIEGTLTAVARLVHAQRDRFTVEVRLLDAEGIAVASGNGSFSLGNHPVGEAQAAQADDVQEEIDDSEAVAFGSMWRTPFGYIHQN